MPELSPEEREAMEAAYLKAEGTGPQICEHMWLAAREYSKQREEELLRTVRELIEAYDDWSVSSYPGDGTSRHYADAWFSEGARVDRAVEAVRAALAEERRRDS